MKKKNEKNNNTENENNEQHGPHQYTGSQPMTSQRV
jgi:hypothetical protein